MPDPTVSVVTAVFNGRRWAAETVRSVRAQTFADFEYILVDDGSTDGSAEVLDAFAAGDRRLRVVRRPNGGIAAAHNTGLESARGRYLAMLDHDDLAEPRRLEMQVRRLERDADLVLLGTQALLIDPAGRPIGPMGGLPCGHDEIERLMLSGRNPVLHPSVMMRRQAVIAAGGYRAEFGGADDYDLFLRLIERGRAANLPTVLTRYRQHFAGFQHAQFARQCGHAAAALREALTRRGLDPASAPPAPTLGARPEYTLHARWAWSALKAGNLDTAWRHLPACVGKLLRGV